AITFTTTGTRRAMQTTGRSNSSRSRRRASTEGSQAAMIRADERSRVPPTTASENCWPKQRFNTCRRMKTEIGLNRKSGREPRATQHGFTKLLIGRSPITEIRSMTNGDPQLLQHPDYTIEDHRLSSSGFP